MNTPDPTLTAEGDLTAAVENLNAILYWGEAAPSCVGGPLAHYERFAPDLRLVLFALSRRPLASGAGDESFQARVRPWMMACFGPEISADRLERNDRFLEEAVELTQASGYLRERAHLLVDYVYDRPQGEINQEVGGVMVTLAAHCLAHGVDMHEAGETELARILQPEIMAKIRIKQAAKPKGSALPIAQPPEPKPAPDHAELVAEARLHAERLRSISGAGLLEGCFDRLADALASAPSGKAGTKCYECDGELFGPVCVACHPAYDPMFRVKLAAENARLREAIEPFAQIGRLNPTSGVIYGIGSAVVTGEHFRRAALAPADGEG